MNSRFNIIPGNANLPKGPEDPNKADGLPESEIGIVFIEDSPTNQDSEANPDASQK